MDQKKLLSPLLLQLEELTETLNKSPYVSREERLVIKNEIGDLVQRLKDGDISYVHGEEKYRLLDKKALLSEISSLMSKLRQINPTSPRVDCLRLLKQEVENDSAAPQQGRQKLQAIMGSDS